MRKVAVFALAASFAMSTGMAWAWSDVSGTVDKINAKNREVTLDNGQSYMIQKKIRMGNLKKGAKVTFSWEARNGKNMVNKVTMEKKS
jgi:Cu/Ag efflux protein CusF